MERVKTGEKLDKRILAHKVFVGEVPEGALESYLKSLPDVSEYAKDVAVPSEPRKRPSGIVMSNDGD